MLKEAALVVLQTFQDRHEARKHFHHASGMTAR